MYKISEKRAENILKSFGFTDNDLKKAHVKEYQRKTKSGNVVTVKEHEDVRTRKQKIDVKKTSVKKNEGGWQKKYSKYKLNRYPEDDINPKDVKVNLKGDINSHAILSWKDRKTGKIIHSYTKEFMQRNADKKWNRVGKVNTRKLNKLKGISEKYLKEGDDEQKQIGAVILMIMETGLRVGNTGLKEKTGNKGVVTLEKRDVKLNRNKISLNFTGKSYQENTAEMDNKMVSGFLRSLMKERKAKEGIFTISNKQISYDIYEKMGFKDFTLKDVRTYVATDIAKNILFKDKMPPPPLAEKITEQRRQIKAKLKNVFEQVAIKLNNTPAVARSSYVHPEVLKKWFEKIGVDSMPYIKKAINEDVEFVEPTLDEIVKETAGKYSNKKIGKINEYDEEYCDEFLF